MHFHEARPVDAVRANFMRASFTSPAVAKRPCFMSCHSIFAEMESNGNCLKFTRDVIAALIRPKRTVDGHVRRCAPQ